MEPSLHFDTNDGPKPESDAKLNVLKRNMTLDFNSTSSSKQRKLAAVLASPDLNMLKLASPELEKMIIQANGMVTTTPTPTQFVFPKFVTEEQEAYARGFVDALAKLQGQATARGINPPRPQDLGLDRTFTTLTVPSALSQSASVPSTAPLHSSSFEVPMSMSSDLSTTTSLPGGPLPSRVPSRSTITPPSILQTSTSSNIPTTATAAAYDVRLPVQIKEEPQAVSGIQNIDSSPPFSPINMESQEKVKLERKRARNRVAARKCRTRKLERISRLEERVADLKGQNNDLHSTAGSLRDQVTKLKQKIVEHVNCGCQIMMTPNISFGDR